MENSISYILIETFVKKTIRELKQDPERSIRNLVDMALRFSEGRFQRLFFQIAQNMLENEESPYYTLLRDLVSYVDPDRLFCFGMNLGYRSCTYGAHQIRKNERERNFHIPWIISLQMDQKSLEHLPDYQKILTEGESLGVYSWLFWSKTVAGDSLPLIKAHPDSAFFLFCEADAITEELMDAVRDIKNIMFVVQYEEDTEEAYTRIRKAGIPYSVFYPYSENDSELLKNGDLFYCAQQYDPVFTILLPEAGCPSSVRELASQKVLEARNRQLYHTIPFELYSDSCAINRIISDDAG